MLAFPLHPLAWHLVLALSARGKASVTVEHGGSVHVADLDQVCKEPMDGALLHVVGEEV